MAKSKPQTKGDIRMADLLDRQDGVGKYAPKNNKAINNSAKKDQLPTSKRVIMSPSLREVPGTRKPLNNAQKDSIIKSWGNTSKKKMMKSGGKMGKCKYGCN